MSPPPRAFPGELPKASVPLLLGEIAGCPFYVGGAQFAYGQHTQLVIDVVPGRGAGFSLEAPRGVRFLTRSRVFDDAEIAVLEAAEAAEIRTAGR